MLRVLQIIYYCDCVVKWLGGVLIKIIGKTTLRMFKFFYGHRLKSFFRVTQFLGTALVVLHIYMVHILYRSLFVIYTCHEGNGVPILIENGTRHVLFIDFILFFRIVSIDY